MAKDKKKDKKDKGGTKGKKGKAAAAARPRASGAAAKKLRDWSQNPMVADIVAAALVASAAALKDTRKAQRLAAESGDELEKLSKKGAERGNALWQMALEIGRRSLEELAGPRPSGGKTSRKRTPSRTATARKKSPR